MFFRRKKAPASSLPLPVVEGLTFTVVTFILLQAVEGFKANEETLKKYVAEYAEKLRSQDQKYNLLKG